MGPSGARAQQGLDSGRNRSAPLSLLTLLLTVSSAWRSESPRVRKLCLTTDQ